MLHSKKKKKGFIYVHPRKKKVCIIICNRHCKLNLYILGAETPVAFALQWVNLTYVHKWLYIVYIFQKIKHWATVLDYIFVSTCRDLRRISSTIKNGVKTRFRYKQRLTVEVMRLWGYGSLQISKWLANSGSKTVGLAKSTILLDKIPGLKQEHVCSNHATIYYRPQAKITISSC